MTSPRSLVAGLSIWVTLAVAAAAHAADLRITREPGTVHPGNDATVSAVAAAKASCSITVEYKSGPSKAGDLTPKIADADGKVSWTWKVGTRTTPGKWPVTIACGKQTVKTTVTVE
jgi:micrococcal nuclease